MYFVKTPKFVQALMPNYTWRVPATDEKIMYLTFDDGPIPEVTPFVLDTLAKYNAKGTFFCVGENISKHPQLFARLTAEGHAIGNHTYNHLNGWATDNLQYFQNIRKCAQYAKTQLFRPPYGRIKPSQKAYLERHYSIIMWDVLSGDFDPRLSQEACYHNVISNAGSGSIVVMHDSLKASANIRYVLPRILEFYANEGYTFQPIHATQPARILQEA